MDLPFVNGLFDLGKNTVELFQKVKNKLVNQPEAANGKLEAVFEELSKVFLAFDTEITNFLSLTFDADTNLKEERKQLYKLEGVELNYRLNEARGHCGKIEKIYEKYLDKWLSAVLSPQENTEMAQLFRDLQDADNGMVRAINEIEMWLNAAARRVLDLIDENKLDEANKLMGSFRKEIRPIRDTLRKTTNELHLLTNSFSDLSGAV